METCRGGLTGREKQAGNDLTKTPPLIAPIFQFEKIKKQNTVSNALV